MTVLVSTVSGAPSPAQCFAPAGPGSTAFWNAAADALLAWSGDGSAPCAVVVARGALVAPLQRALQGRAGALGRPWVPPAIRPLAQWVRDLVPEPPVDALARTMGMVHALQQALPEALASRSPAERLSFAAGVLDVLDAFEQAGAAGRLDDPVWAARVVEAFGSPAAEVRVREDLAVLARIAQAAGADTAAGSAERMRALAACWAARKTRVAWLDWQSPEPSAVLLLAELERRLPDGRLLRLEPDWAALGAAAPLLRAAWPERFDAPIRPLRERVQRWRQAPAGPRPEVLHAADREQEAQLAAQWVHGRLARPVALGRAPPPLAIVALDRWLARRVRALLERGGVLVDDREGWLLSTTVSATAAMGWLDLVASDGYYDDLLGWLDSRFVRPPNRLRLRAWIDRCATRHRYLRGWRGLAQAADGAAPPPELAALTAQVEQQRRTQPLLAHLEALAAAMRWAGAPRRLAADEAGRQLLGLLDALRRAALAPVHARPLGFTEFRALLALLFERHRYFGAIDSPVELLTPADAAGRPFEAVLVLGAAHGVLPSSPPPLPLVNEPLRLLLGLPTAAAQAQRQHRDLALLLVLASDTAITCRTDPSDGTRPSPWIERLEALTADAPLADRVDRPGVWRPVAPATARRPSVPLAALPPRLPVGGIERLVACPFRFLAQDGWRLREAPEPIDVPGVRERGELVHEILERFHATVHGQGLGFEDAGRDALLALLGEVTTAVAARELASGGGALGELAEWQATLERYLDWSIADAAAGWRWAAGERDGAAVVRWAGPDGGPRAIRIEGRLDRLDTGPGGLRIVDYKLGDPDRLRRVAKAPAQAAQLALYAWIAAADGPVVASGYLSLRRSGVAWVPLERPADEVLADWRVALPGYLARIDAGEPLVASGTDCAYCPTRGLCRKGHWT